MYLAYTVIIAIIFTHLYFFEYSQHDCVTCLLSMRLFLHYVLFYTQSPCLARRVVYKMKKKNMWARRTQQMNLPIALLIYINVLHNNVLLALRSKSVGRSMSQITSPPKRRHCMRSGEPKTRRLSFAFRIHFRLFSSADTVLHFIHYFTKFCLYEGGSFCCETTF